LERIRNEKGTYFTLQNPVAAQVEIEADTAWALCGIALVHGSYTHDFVYAKEKEIE
jgi:hypothetical protein